MSLSRPEVARRVIAAILICDALLFWFIAMQLVVSAGDALLNPESWMWGLICGGPFALAAARVLSGRGIERVLFAQVLAWLTAWFVPLILAFFVYLGSTKKSDQQLIRYTFLVALVQLGIPALVKWARSDVGFVRAYVPMVAILAGLFVYTYIRL